MAPALGAVRTDITARLRAIRPAEDGVESPLAGATIVAQIALTLVRWWPPAVRALARTRPAVHPGFDMTNVVTATFDSE